MSVGHRQQRLVAPDVLRAGLDLGPGDVGEVVADLRAGRSTPGRRRTGRAAGWRGTRDRPGATALPKAPSRTAVRARTGRCGCAHEGASFSSSPVADSRRGTELAPWPRAGPDRDVRWRVAGASAGRVPLPLSMSRLHLTQPSQHVHIAPTIRDRGGAAGWRRAVGGRSSRSSTWSTARRCSGCAVAAHRTGPDRAAGRAGLLVATGYRLPVPVASAFTVGNVVAHAARPGLARRAARRCCAHEERHTWQYVACLGLPMLPLYLLAAGLVLPARRRLRRVHNAFERLAGLDGRRLPDARPASAARLAGRAANGPAGRARPPGPSTTTSASSASASCSSEAEQTSSAGRPCSRRSATAWNASRSPRSSPANSTPPASVLRERRRAARCPCACRARAPRAPAGRARGAGRAARRRRPAPPPAGANAAVGVGQPAGVHGDREALLLDEGVVGVLLGQQPGQLVTERLRGPAGGSGDVNSRVVGVPALVAVLAHHHQPGAVRGSASASRLEVGRARRPGARAGR